MKELRIIRIFLAAIFFVAAVAYLAIGASVHPAAGLVKKAQIIPSALSTCIGAVAVWLVLTFLLGRVYCSTVCPVGTLQDVFMKARRWIPRFRRPFRYRRPSPIRYYILAIYIFCILALVAAVPFWIEPWSIMRNICGDFHPAAEAAEWIRLGVGVTTGIIAGIVSGVLLLVCSVVTGRGFCTDICPVGTALGCLNSFTMMHIEIDPDRCISCMKCEDICKCQCIKVSQRYVDNSRCVKCFDCLHVCPVNAIRYQSYRNRRQTPLMEKSGSLNAGA